MHINNGNSEPFVWLPCLRCGQQSVPVPTLFLAVGGSGTTWNCRFRPCEAEHFLSIYQADGTFVVVYQRYTLRYPLEFYDEGVTPTDIRFYIAKQRKDQLDDDGYLGPVKVYPRKRRFSSTEVKAIWSATRGQCHICRHRWQLNQRGVRGWHIDHVIPHVGGGSDTESRDNLRVACARCNLKKGKGFTEAAIRLGLRDLILSLGG
jgi:hypothetical protein